MSGGAVFVDILAELGNITSEREEMSLKDFLRRHLRRHLGRPRGMDTLLTDLRPDGRPVTDRQLGIL